ncbi:MAG: J domain-containing protein [Desulfonauticus sp.]|nr:J domain-containing protein [Desulfonauticus sp.]
MRKRINFQDLEKAKNIFQLGDKACIQEIKQRYYALLKKWHPDKCSQSKTKALEMTQKIVEAYKLLIAYCEQYAIPLNKQEIKEDFLDPEEWWRQRFGEDPLWGTAKDIKAKK